MSGISKRVSGSWVSGDYGIMGTSTDTIATLPAIIYPNDTTATVGLKGNMEQSGTPTPSSPIQPSECGDLETVGEKAGQYKIPISSASTTTPVYLGEVESTRRVKKLVLTGEEACYQYIYQNTKGIEMSNMLGVKYTRARGSCSHYPVATTSSTNSLWIGVNNTTLYFVGILDALGLSTATAFKQWLAQQYSNGTPVTVWYVLATPTTGIVNEPLMKIGDYADEVSGITVPTITGADSFDVETTLKPSEVSLSYTGWHPVQSVHEAVQSNNLFNPEHHITIENLDYIGDVYPANKYRVNNVSNFPCYYKIGESGTTATINPPANVYLNASDVVYIWCSVNSNRKIGVTEGSTPLPYEPYGIIWNP